MATTPSAVCHGHLNISIVTEFLYKSREELNENQPLALWFLFSVLCRFHSMSTHSMTDFGRTFMVLKSCGQLLTSEDSVSAEELIPQPSTQWPWYYHTVHEPMNLYLPRGKTRCLSSIIIVRKRWTLSCFLVIFCTRILSPATLGMVKKKSFWKQVTLLRCGELPWLDNEPIGMYA